MIKNSVILAGLLLAGCNSHTDDKQNAVRVIYEQKTDSANTPVVLARDSAFIDTSQSQSQTVSAHKPLTLIIKNLASSTAPVMVSFFGVKNKFLKESDILKQYKFFPDGKDLKAQISDLDYGELAFASYQDLNGDGKINRTPLGLPKEPYCFSNNYKPTIRAPKFKECQFYYSDSNNVEVTSMIR